MAKKMLMVCACLVCLELNFGCKKLVEIPPPQTTTVTSEVFNSESLANPAIVGIYSSLANSGSPDFGSGAVTILSGLSADELGAFDQTFEDQYGQFQFNALNFNTGLVYTNFWKTPYSVIYNANAAIEGLGNSTGLPTLKKNEYTGEAKFLRAFCYFYLTNFFGDVPLITTTNWNKTQAISRTSGAKIYQQIIQDLIDAQTLLPEDYSLAGGEKIRANKYAATALLARVYLYQNDWKDAASQTTVVINNTSLYKLADSLTGVFLSNSSEAILQLQQNNAAYPFNGTWEGNSLISTQPNSTVAFLSNSLLAAFEPNDLRKNQWVASGLDENNNVFYFPFKYTLGSSQVTPNGDIPQYYMILRLAEQYLIRAEAEAHGAGNGLNAAVSDLNIIRHRAGLPDYQGTISEVPVLAAIARENQIEFFSEWGHRWLDLKRTGQAAQTLSTEKGITVSKNSLLYPIPIGEIQSDPNLTQNPGY